MGRSTKHGDYHRGGGGGGRGRGGGRGGGGRGGGRSGGDKRKGIRNGGVHKGGSNARNGLHSPRGFELPQLRGPQGFMFDGPGHSRSSYGMYERGFEAGMDASFQRGYGMSMGREREAGMPRPLMPGPPSLIERGRPSMMMGLRGPGMRGYYPHQPESLYTGARSSMLRPSYVAPPHGPPPFAPNMLPPRPYRGFPSTAPLLPPPRGRAPVNPRPNKARGAKLANKRGADLLPRHLARQGMMRRGLMPHLPAMMPAARAFTGNHQHHHHHRNPNYHSGPMLAKARAQMMRGAGRQAPKNKNKATHYMKKSAQYMKKRDEKRRAYREKMIAWRKLLYSHFFFIPFEKRQSVEKMKEGEEEEEKEINSKEEKVAEEEEEEGGSQMKTANETVNGDADNDKDGNDINENDDDKNENEEAVDKDVIDKGNHDKEANDDIVAAADQEMIEVPVAEVKANKAADADVNTKSETNVIEKNGIEISEEPARENANGIDPESDMNSKEAAEAVVSAGAAAEETAVKILQSPQKSPSKRGRGGRRGRKY